MSEIYDVRNNPEASQFETTVDGHVALVAYRMQDGKIVFTHTEVPSALEGRGIASQLVRKALDHARAESLRVVPLCPYVSSWLRKHPEYSDLVENADR